MKSWLLPYPFKIVGHLFLLLLLVLCVASIFVESSLSVRLPWLMGGVRIVLYLAIVFTTLVRDKDEDEMTSSLRGRALKEVAYCVLIIYAVYNIVMVLIGQATYLLHDEELITPMMVWVVYFGRFEQLKRKLRKREFTL